MITYLFGAGASKHALPLVEEIPERIDKMIEILGCELNQFSDNEKFEEFDGVIPDSKLKIRDEFVNNLRHLNEKIKKHSSIDTYAKKLFISKKKNEYNLLKIVFTCYFILEQVKEHIDYRYDSFLASILKENCDDLPNEIRILTWNYDFQFEKAFSEYMLNYDMNKIQKKLNIFPNYMMAGDVDSFGIFKLNGTTCSYNLDTDKIENSIALVNLKFDKDSIGEVLVLYKNFMLFFNSHAPALRYSWENKDYAYNIREKAKEATKNTDTLVIIGYSMPFFNRDIDRNIIRNMTNLKNVYFQAPDKIANEYITTFKSILPDFTKNKENNLIPIPDVKQFFIPPEL